MVSALLLLLSALLAAASLPAAPPTSGDGIIVQGMLEPSTGERRRYQCPGRFVRMGNSCYFMSTVMASWHDAHFHCRGLGAHLAAFERRWEDRNMRHYLQREELAPLARWVGGIFQPRLRRWVWGSSGRHITYKAFPRRAVTRDWAWHCLSLDAAHHYAWRPSSCMDWKHFICEAPLRKLHATRKERKGRKGGGHTRKTSDGITLRVLHPSGWLTGNFSATPPHQAARREKQKEALIAGDSKKMRDRNRDRSVNKNKSRGRDAARRAKEDTVHRRPDGPHSSWPGRVPPLAARTRPRVQVNPQPQPPQYIDVSLEVGPHRPSVHGHPHALTSPAPRAANTAATPHATSASSTATTRSASLPPSATPYTPPPRRFFHNSLPFTVSPKEDNDLSNDVLSMFN